MKQVASWCLLGLLAAGCPLYDTHGCFNANDCAPGFACDIVSNRCVELTTGDRSCNRPRDCGRAETCTRRGICQPGSCFVHGCVSGFRCDVVNGVHECVRGDEAAQPDAASPTRDGGQGPALDAAPVEDAGRVPNDGSPAASSADADANP